MALGNDLYVKFLALSGASLLVSREQIVSIHFLMTISWGVLGSMLVILSAGNCDREVAFLNCSLLYDNQDHIQRRGLSNIKV